MLEELLAKLQFEIEESKSQVKNLKGSIEQAKSEMHYKKPEEPKTYTKEMVMQKAPNYTLYKSDRFKNQKGINGNQSQQLDQSGLSMLSVTSAMDMVNRKQPNPVFSKEERFKGKNQIDERNYDVNIDVIKKKPTGAVIMHGKNQGGSEQKKHPKQKLLENQSQTTVNSKYDELETQASASQQSELGPGAYDVNYTQVDKFKTFSIPKSSRFPQSHKLDEQLNIQPDYNIVKKRTPGVKICGQSKKTKQQLQKQIEKKQQEIESAKIQLQQPVDYDKMTRAHIGNLIMEHIDAAPRGSREKKCMMFMLLERIRAMRGAGPADYNVQKKNDENQEKEAEQNREGRKKKQLIQKGKSKTPSPHRRFLMLEHQIPGPNYYYCKDDLIYEKKPVFTIAKAGITEKPPEIDRRHDLEPNIDFVKKRAPTFVIKEESEKIERFENFVQDKMGPGKYDQNYKLVEKRVDIGNVRLQELTEKNARENQMDPIKQLEVFDNDNLNPNIQAIKPNPKAFQYHEETEVQAEHIPDKLLFQSHHQFYDYDLNRIREDFGKGGNIGYGDTKDEFVEHEQFMQAMHAYFERQKKQPEIGEYDPVFKLIEKQQQIPNFDKYISRDTEPIEKPEGPLDGDNLILNPDKQKPKLPNINMKLITGRPEKDPEENENQPVLLLDPQKPQKKVKGQVQLNKQSQREDFEEKKQEALEEPVLDLNPKYDQVEPKVKGYYEYDKQNRCEEEIQQKEVEVYIDPNFNVNKPSVKKQVDMSKGQTRFV